MPKAPSRPKRWAAAVAKIEDGLSELEELKSEYEDWQSNLPDNAQDGPTADLLQGIADLDIESIRSTLEEIESVDLPRGYGRD